MRIWLFLRPYVKEIYLLPWTIWCGVSFFLLTGICFLIIFPLLFINNPRVYAWCHHLPTYTARIIAFAWFVRVHRIGMENFSPSSQYIFVGNHRSMLDAIISSGFIPNPKKFIGKAELLKWPFIGYILGRLYIPVNRKDKASRLWSKEQLLLKMKEGFSMVIFAEGTTNFTEQVLLEFKDGAFEASCQSGVAIVPFVIDKADKLWHRNVWLIRPGKITLSFLPSFLPQENNETNVNNLKQGVYKDMYKEYLRLNSI